jgi:hypothetical protein
VFERVDSLQSSPDRPPLALSQAATSAACSSTSTRGRDRRGHDAIAGVDLRLARLILLELAVYMTIIMNI